jgi:hypothetical protein
MAHLWWHITTLAVAWGIFSLGYFSAGFLRRILQLLPLVFYVGITGALMIWSLSFSGARPSFPLLENENSIAAVLVITSTVGLVLWEPLWLVFLQPVSVLATLFTGSRIALGVYLLVLVMKVFDWRSRYKIVLIALVVFGSLLLWLVSQPRERTNLLKFSNDFSQPIWRTALDEAIFTLQSTSALGPFRENDATHLNAQSDANQTHGIFLLQGSGYSLPDEPYIASVYLRSDTPQQLILRNHAGNANVICEVTSAWQRCVTPVGYGTGKSSVQLQLRTLTPGDSLDIYLWGPQLEIATEPSEVVLTENTLWERLLYRIPLRTDALKPENIVDFSYRLEIARSAWQVFLAQPLAGVGLGGLRPIFAAQDFAASEPPVHAHNLVLQLLAEMGVLGLLAWLLTFWGTLLTVGRTHWRQLAPLVIAVLLLNTVDFTYFTNVAYYAYWLTVGLVTSPCAEGES